MEICETPDVASQRKPLWFSEDPLMTLTVAVLQAHWRAHRQTVRAYSPSGIWFMAMEAQTKAAAAVVHEAE